MRKMEALDQEHQSENYFKGLRKKNFQNTNDLFSTKE